VRDFFTGQMPFLSPNKRRKSTGGISNSEQIIYFQLEFTVSWSQSPRGVCC